MNDEPMTAATVDAGQEDLNTWALVEVFGHTKIAGRVTTRKMGTEVMFQIDVPDQNGGFEYSQLYSPKSIFAIKPTTEDWCRRWSKAAKQFSHDVLPYIPETRPQLEEGTPEEEE